MNVKNTVSVFALVSLLVGAVFAIGDQGVVWVEPRNQLEATLVVPDANGLMPGSKLLLRGAEIGIVTHVRAAADRVEVAFRYDPDRKIPVDSAFRVENLSALGETYLAVLPSSDTGPHLSDHQRIQAQPGTVPTTFAELSAALTRLMTDISPSELNAAITELSAALPENRSTIANLTHAGSLLSTTMLMSSGAIRGLLTDSQSLLERSQNIGPSLTASAEPVQLAGINFAEMAETAIAMLHTNDYPHVIQVGPLALFNGLQRFEDNIGTDVRTLSTSALPSVQAAAVGMSTIDVSRLLDTALAAVSVPGTLSIHVSPPK